MKARAAIVTLGALALSSAIADAKLTEIQAAHVRPRLEVGDKSCLKKAAKGDLVSVHFSVGIDHESDVGEKGKVLADTRSEPHGPFSLLLGKNYVHESLDDALHGACAGERLIVRLPHKFVTGALEQDIPAGADVIFDVEVMSVMVPNEKADYATERKPEDMDLDIADGDEAVITNALNAAAAAAADEADAADASATPPKEGKAKVPEEADAPKVVVSGKKNAHPLMDDSEIEDIVYPDPAPKKEKGEGKDYADEDDGPVPEEELYEKVAKKAPTSKPANVDPAEDEQPKADPDFKLPEGENPDFFALIDVNKDGWLTQAEYKNFCYKAGLRWKLWKMVFAQEDADQDGMINWWEYMGPKGERPPSYMILESDA